MLASHNDVDSVDESPSPRPTNGARRGPGRPKGAKRLRKPLEPSAEFKELHAEATSAFIDGFLGQAEELAKDAILANPEMFTAHSLLSEIYLAQGDQDRALSALFNAAHTRPRDTEIWRQVAELILERAGAGEDRRMLVESAEYCYSRIVQITPELHEARLQRALLNRELRRYPAAIKDFARLWKDFPDTPDHLRNLAACYLESGKSAEAIPFYDEAILRHQSSSDAPEALDWSDANIYAELFLDSKLYADGLQKIKRMFRWLLGRGQDAIWEDVNEDDREFDRDHEPRRFEVAFFDPDRYVLSSYGIDLPMELRIKLGVFRLKQETVSLDEAMSHLEYLEPDTELEDSKVFDYPDLFKDAADALQTAGFHQQALRFYEPLQNIDEVSPDFCFSGMATAYRALGLFEQAEECYRILIESNEDDVGPLQEVIQMFNDGGQPYRSIPYVKQLAVRRRRVPEPVRQEELNPEDQPMDSIEVDDQELPEFLRSIQKKAKIRRGWRVRRRFEMIPQQENLEPQFLLLHELQTQLEAGDETALTDWLAVAEPLVERFRHTRLFFPADRHYRFFGYTREARAHNWLRKAEQEKAYAALQHTVPTEFCRVGFDAWFDLWLQHCVHLATRGRAPEAYELLRTALNCVLWLHDDGRMRVLHATWTAVALRAGDDQALCGVARYFMQRHPFATDGYRLYAALHLLCPPPNLWYNNNASQKHMLRQVKAVDHSLRGRGGPRPAGRFAERAHFNTRPGQAPRADRLDPALLLLYGQLLYASGSYAYALHYFFRALAVDPDGVLVLLSCGLAFVHHALKRQTENRHRTILQGLSFLFRYLERRERSTEPAERQEATFNVGRTFHMLGLAHLAVPYYERVLEMSEEMQRHAGAGRGDGPRAREVDTDGDTALPDAAAEDGDGQEPEDEYTEDFGMEAAYALQLIWLASENTEQAMVVTEKWLVI